jgi:hypothetical protein
MIYEVEVSIKIFARGFDSTHEEDQRVNEEVVVTRCGNADTTEETTNPYSEQPDNNPLCDISIYNSV